MVAKEDAVAKDARRGRAADAVLRALGRRGRFQVLQVNLIMLGALASAFQLFNIVFIGGAVGHQCAPSPNATNTSDLDMDGVMVYQQCRQGVAPNASSLDDVIWRPCQHGWTYHASKSSSIVSEFDLVCERGFLSQLSQTLFIAGQGVGALLFPALSDRLGRRPVVLATHAAMTALAAGLTLASSYPVFALLRLAIGALQQGVILGVSTYTIEQFPPEDRILMGVACQLYWGVSVALLAPLAFLLRHQSWHTLQGVLAVFGAVVLIQLAFQEESLRWLITNDRMEKARRILKKAAKQNGRDYQRVMEAYRKAMAGDDRGLGEGQGEGEGEEERETAQAQASSDVPSYHLLHLLCSRTMMTYLFILWFAWFTDSMTYFSLYLSAGSIHADKHINFLLNSLADLPSSLLFWLCVDRIGRRRSLLLFHVMAAVPLLLVTLLRQFLDGKAVEVVATVLAFVGKLGISSAFNSLFFYTPEIFPTNLRNLGIGTSSLAARAGGMLAPFAGKLAALYPWAPGAIFSICCFIVIAVFIFMPETRGRVLPTSIAEVEAWGGLRRRRRQRVV